MSGLSEIMLLLVGSLLFGCTVQLPADAPPPAQDWQKVEIKGRFSFSLPPEMKQTPVEGMDSLVREYASPHVRLGFDYGWYSDPLDYPGRVDYQAGMVEIDGRKAKLVTFRSADAQTDFANFAGIHLADPGDGQNKLTMWARYQNPADLSQIKKIFQSIKISEK